jgi:hypothetical protein
MKMASMALSKAPFILALATLGWGSTGYHLILRRLPIDNTSDYAIDRQHNFALTGASGKGYSTWTDPTGAGPLKYTDLVLSNFGSQGICYEVTTQGGSSYINPSNSFVNGVATANPDTRFWTQSGPSSWQKVNDDIGSGSFASTARIWLGPSAGLTLRVSVYGTGSNGIDFNIKTRRFTVGTTAGTCATNPVFTLSPFVSVTNGWPVVTNGR